MIPNSRKPWQRLLILPLLLAILGLSPLIGVRAPVAASHNGVIAMKCVCGSAVRSTRDIR
jgi:hypothetical protein